MPGAPDAPDANGVTELAHATRHFVNCSIPRCARRGRFLVVAGPPPRHTSMRRPTLSILLSIVPIHGLAAQSNTVSGLDGDLFDISSPRIWGRRGPTFPGGEFGFSARNDMCNPGSVLIPWQAAMQPNHPKFGFMIVRESGGRMVQISDWSYIKHAFTS